MKMQAGFSERISTENRCFEFPHFDAIDKMVNSELSIHLQTILAHQYRRESLVGCRFSFSFKTGKFWELGWMFWNLKTIF